MKKSFFSLLLIFIAIYSLFQISDKIQNTKEEINRLTKKIEQSKNNIHILKAEWAYLSNPQRIKTLSQKYLSSKLQTASQFKKSNKYLVYNDRQNKNKNLN